ncbi:MAG: hypothetical protein KDA58_09830 [Planctomycetaceae bacterium]|nr:hypothetical protein [Planctomycetaceae bacterium]
MTDPFRHVRRGEPLQISATTFNALLDAAQSHRRREQQRQRRQRWPLQDADRLLVRNDSAGPRQRFEVLGIEDIVLGPEENLDTFLSRPAVVGTEPQFWQRGKWVVLAEPVAVGQIGTAIVSGAVPVRLIVDDEDAGFQYADIDPGDAHALRALPRGSAFILWREGGEGEQWALVRLSNLPPIDDEDGDSSGSDSSVGDSSQDDGSASDGDSSDGPSITDASHFSDGSDGSDSQDGSDGDASDGDGSDHSDGSDQSDGSDGNSDGSDGSDHSDGSDGSDGQDHSDGDGSDHSDSADGSGSGSSGTADSTSDGSDGSDHDDADGSDGSDHSDGSDGADHSDGSGDSTHDSSTTDGSDGRSDGSGDSSHDSTTPSDGSDGSDHDGGDGTDTHSGSDSVGSCAGVICQIICEGGVPKAVTLSFAELASRLKEHL